MMRGVRGAITVDNNQADSIRAAVGQLIGALLDANHIDATRIISVFFAVTPDLTALNPAFAAREVRSDWQRVPMLCSQEPVVEGMLPYCIRVLIQWEAADDSLSLKPVYLGKAQKLRPDLVEP